MSRIPKSVIEEVLERSGGRCEAHHPWGSNFPDGGPKAPFGPMALHHRQARAMGGSRRLQGTAANLLHLHQRCHEYVHANPEWSREHGYIVSQYAETP